MAETSTKQKGEEDEDVYLERCEDCVRCYVKVSCGKCSACESQRTCVLRRCFRAKQLYDERMRLQCIENVRKIMQIEEQRTAAAAATSSSSSGAMVTPATGAPESEKKKRGRKKGSTNRPLAMRLNEQYANEGMRATRQLTAETRRSAETRRRSEADFAPKQCLNPDCILEAVTGSKYCSKECGKHLTLLRLTEMLPNRVAKRFATRETFEEEYASKIRVLEQEMTDLSKWEQHLDSFNEQLMKFVEKQINVEPNLDKKEEKTEDTMYESCIICGQPDIPMKKYGKHVETCWTRTEKQIAFGNSELTNDTIYCEKYNPKTQTYCKRLKSMCPEHRKPGPETALKICGYPMKWVENQSLSVSALMELKDAFGSTGCQLAKDQCSKHNKWVPAIRASLELEKQTIFVKIFELGTERKKLNEYVRWIGSGMQVLGESYISDEEDVDVETVDQPTTSTAIRPPEPKRRTPPPYVKVSERKATKRVERDPAGANDYESSISDVVERMRCEPGSSSSPLDAQFSMRQSELQVADALNEMKVSTFGGEVAGDVEGSSSQSQSQSP